MMKDAGSYLDYLDDATWQRLVGALLNLHGAEILSRHSKEIFTGIGAGTRIYRVAGTAAAGGRRPVDWTTGNGGGMSTSHRGNRNYRARWSRLDASVPVRFSLRPTRKL